MGDGDGLGYTINAPMPAEFGDPEYLRFFDDLIIPIGRAFKPEFHFDFRRLRLSLS